MASFSQITTNLPRSRFVPDKSRGQNFLIDKNVLAKIIAAADLKPSDRVIEIGAGTGVLTRELAKRVKKVAAFEVDEKLSDMLREKFKNMKNVQVVNKDIRDTRYEIRDRRYKVVANIPYNITSAVLEKFLSPPIRGSQRGSFFRPPSLMVLLVQREVAERICARPGEMSVLSVMVQYYGQPEIIATVPSSAFWPRPKVDSAILKIKVGANNYSPLQGCSVTPLDEKIFFQIVKAGFSRRRKMLKNNLKSLKNLKALKDREIEKWLEKNGLPSNIRAQELGVEDWVKLAKELGNLTNISLKE